MADADYLYSAIWHVAASTGLRRGELQGLCWQDVHVERGAPRIRQTLVTTDDSRLILNAPKTDAERCVVRLDAETLAISMGPDRLGHSSIQITVDTYSHVLPDMRQRAAEGVGAAVFGIRVLC